MVTSGNSAEQSTIGKGIKGKSSCMPGKKYSWGFSSSLLLTFTFCVYTFIFAAVACTLEVETFLYSRTQRNAPSYSIYNYILAIADALSSQFGQEVRQLTLKELDKKIDGYQGGIRIQTGSLALSRVGGMRHEAALRQAKWDASQHTGHGLSTLIPVRGEGTSQSGLLEPQEHAMADNETMSSHDQPELDALEIFVEARPLQELEGEVGRINL